MASEIRTLASTDKDLHTSYQTTTDARPLQVTSNEKIFEHREHQRLSPPLSREHGLFGTEAAWYRIRRFMQEPFSEFFGVFVMILFGDGVVAQVVLSNSTRGDYQSISWCWGYAAQLRQTSLPLPMREHISLHTMIENSVS